MRRILFTLLLMSIPLWMLGGCGSGSSGSSNSGTPETAYNEVAAGILTVSGCEKYVAAHPLYPGELLCCSNPSAGSAPACSAGDVPDIACVAEFQFCDNGIALKALSPDPKTGQPGHMVSTSGSWHVNATTGELTVTTISQSETMGAGMIMEMTEYYPDAFTYNEGNRLDLESLAAVSIDADGFGTYRRENSSNTRVTGLWTANMDATLTTEAVVSQDGYSATREDVIECTPEGSMVCRVTPPSNTISSGGEHSLPLDLYVTVAGTKMYQSSEARTFVYEKQPNLCVGVADGNACGGRGICQDGVCECSHGYIGADCDVPAQCAEDCSDNATCVSGSCVCNAGFEGADCSDIDECGAGTDSCGANSACVNLPGSYACDCAEGYAGRYCDTCDDDTDLDGYGPGVTPIPECRLGTGDCNDNDPAVYPGAPEVCDGIDNQCSGDPGYGSVDEDFMITCTPMVPIPGGTFSMGDAFEEGWPDELPVHSVSVSSFQMDPYEITNKHYAECVGDSSCQAPSSNASHSRRSYYGNPTYDNYPVIWLSWQQANDYCDWAGKRLPTEAEWEYAARGTNDGQPEGQRYPWGDSITDADANYDFNTADNDTSEVGSYPATGYGLYDMAGNVWEWVADWYDDRYYATVHAQSDNPQGPPNGVRRVSRGGSFDHDAYGLRNSARCDFCHQDRHGNNLGARCAR